MREEEEEEGECGRGRVIRMADECAPTRKDKHRATAERTLQKKQREKIKSEVPAMCLQLSIMRLRKLRLQHLLKWVSAERKRTSTGKEQA